MIVQATDMESAADAVRAVGGEVTHELGIINAVAATVSEGQLGLLREWGCPGSQGFLLSPAVPGDAMAALLSDGLGVA